eukprot:scaffold7123_cov119-Isochrysis_galbana.AAC.2
MQEWHTGANIRGGTDFCSKRNGVRTHETRRLECQMRQARVEPRQQHTFFGLLTISRSLRQSSRAPLRHSGSNAWATIASSRTARWRATAGTSEHSRVLRAHAARFEPQTGVTAPQGM